MGGGQGRAAHEGDNAEAEAGMINLQFFPSRQLALYTVRLFLTRSIGVLVGLVLVLMMLDLLGESGKILAVPGNGDAELWRYVGLRIPLLVGRFLPFSVLLGTLIAFVGLNQNSEVVAMKAAGISAHQMLAPLIIASLGVSVLAFAFNETVVVHSARVVNAWSDNDYKPVPPESGILSNVWVIHGSDLVRARVAAGQGSAFRAQGITIYQREGGAIRRIIDAQRAAPDGARWRLENVRIYDSTTNLVRRVPVMDGLAGLTPDQLRIAQVNPDETSFFQLATKISEMRAAGKPTAEARAGLWHKISGPLSIALMPLLAAVAAFGLARSGQVLLRASIGMALCFAYFVADNFSLAMGNVGAYPPLLAAWAPFFLFLLVGETVLIRSEE
jgi:lipopolysaccharide export system permease protein